MKNIILLASLSAFLAAPVVGCEMGHAKDDKLASAPTRARSRPTPRPRIPRRPRRSLRTTTKKAKI